MSVSIKGTVRDAGGGIVPIVVDRDTMQYPGVGDDAICTFIPQPPDHVCKEVWYGRRPDGMWEVKCMAEGHPSGPPMGNPNRIRVLPLYIAEDKLPRYHGEGDMPDSWQGGP